MKIKILILALSIVTLAGCGNDESPLGDTTGNSGPTALHVNGNICVTSRANDTRWEPNDRIGIYMLAGETVEQNNKLYTTTDGSGKFTATEAETIYLPTDGSRRNFVAYYPYTENLGDNGRTYMIDITDQSSQGAIDLLGSDNPETDKNTPSVRFTFNHKLAKIELNITSGTGFDDSSVLEGLTVELTGQQTSATYDVIDGNEVTIVTETPRTVDLLVTNEGRKAEAIILPSDNFDEMSLIFKLKDGGHFTWPVQSDFATRFETGKKYKFNVTLNKTEIGVTSEIVDWISGNGTGDSGEAE